MYIFNNTLPLFIQSQCLSCNVWLFVHQALIPSQQQGPYYTQALYAPPPHVIHHTTVVQPNGMPAAMYAPPIPPPRNNGVTMGMVAGTTMAMSAGELQQFIESYPGYKCVRFVVLPVAFTPQELCWQLHHQRPSLPTQSRCPHIGLLAHPATATCPRSGEEREVWVCFKSITSLVKGAD